MDIQSRILKGRLIEKMNRNPEYSKLLGLHDRTSFCEVPLEAPSPQKAEAETSAACADPKFREPDGPVEPGRDEPPQM